MDESDGKVLRKWVSVGDVIVLLASLLGIAVSYGDLRRQVELSDDLMVIRRDVQGPTPGAAQALVAIQTKDAAQDQQIAEIRQEQRESRREILMAVQDLGAKLDRHMDGTRPR